MWYLDTIDDYDRGILLKDACEISINLSIYLSIYLIHLSITSMYHIYLSYLCIISIYLTIYQIYLSIISIYHIYLSYLSITITYHIYVPITSHHITSIISTYYVCLFKLSVSIIISKHAVIIYAATWTCSHVWATWILDLSKISVRYN